MKPVVFGKYTLLRRLAQGGMAELYLGRSHKTYGVERIVVIKVIASRFAADPSFSQMFSDEVRIAATLTHPNIGQVVDVGEVEGRQYLAMEYLHGKDMRGIVRALRETGQRGVPYGVAVLAGSRICAALNHAHEARDLEGAPLGIIHRDVSPSNIMITFEGQVKLLDFGIAKAANRSSLTQPGMIKGKVRYLSPEQLMGEAIDHRTDIFTLGISLWESTVGQHLFDGDQDVQVYDAISSGRIRRPASLVPDFPPDLERVLMRALAHSPDDRYPTATAMQADLERYAQSAGLALSELQVAGFLRELYVEEYMNWEQSKAAGMSILDYLVSQASPEDMRLEGVLAGEDVRKTRLSSALPPVAGKIGDEGDTEGGKLEPQDTIRKTMLFGDKPLPAPQPRKARQSASGPITLGGATAKKGATADQSSGPSLRVATGSAVEVTPDGHASVVPSATNAPFDREDSRATLMATGDAVDVTLPPVDAPAPRVIDGRADTMPSGILAPVFSDDRKGLAEAKTTASDRKLSELQGNLPQRPARPATGDWSQKGQQRPGTHPYFKGDPNLPEPSGLVVPEEAFTLPRKRWPLYVALTLIGLSLLGGAAWSIWVLTRSDAVADAPPKTTTKGEPQEPAKHEPKKVATAASQPASQPASRPKPKAEPETTPTIALASEPTGATVYLAANGQELGKTPLPLDIGKYANAELEFHLKGYAVTKLKVPTRGDKLVAMMQQKVRPAPKTPRLRPKRPKRPKRPRRPGKKPKGGDLKDPFG